MRLIGRGGLLAIFLVVLGAAPAEAATFSNPTPINTPQCMEMDCAATGRASPYPSTINVSGLPDGISKARATLSGFTHQDGNDLDALLVGPGGHDTILMHAVCGGPQSLGTFVFDDAASRSLPLSGPCPTGSYRPSSSSSNDAFFLPNAPPPPYDLAMSVFNGGPANGTWRVFVIDNGFSETGVLSGGWSLQLASGKCAGKAALEPAHVGTAGNDVLTGTPGADVMLGLAGRDRIKGKGGKDVICGGPGKDDLKGGGAKDKLFGQGGKDNLNGQGGTDTCKGGGGNDSGSCEKEKSL
jgi:Ca2+-binding RTX toxin-like protein